MVPLSLSLQCIMKFTMAALMAGEYVDLFIDFHRY